MTREKQTPFSKDTPDIPSEVKKSVNLVFVKTVDDVLREAPVSF